MASLNEKLAGSLSNLRNLGADGSHRIFKSNELSRTDRERLASAGFLREVIRGWVMITRPEDRVGDTSSWYASFWQFCRAYLDDRFGTDWALSAENSISLLAANLNVPRQVIVCSPQANNQPLALPHETSLYLLRVPKLPVVPVETAGLRTFPTAEALCSAVPAFWQNNNTDVIALLGSVRSTSSILRVLLEGGHTLAAGRVAGAYRLLGNARAADDIVSTMERAGHKVREDEDPFKAPVPMQLAGSRPVSPIVTRVRLMWAEMRGQVLQTFEVEPRLINDRDAYLASVDDRYTSDAYHSLSIEGYAVSEELIEKVRSGSWNPDGDESDREQKNAMAAKGYWDAFQEVRKSVARVLDGEDAAAIVEAEHLNWYRALFQPSLAAGIVKPENLAGYRQHFVGIRGSIHTPASWESIPDAMEAFFECLREEKDPRVRAILGHFIFTFIHPLPDGNGRSGRFIMNVMLASAGIPWTIIPVDRRDEYMRALDSASIAGDIKPFAGLVADCAKHEPPPPRRSRPGEVLPEADLDAAPRPKP
jgi:hypothetical protein